jgi:hypothetical protein
MYGRCRVCKKQRQRRSVKVFIRLYVNHVAHHDNICEMLVYRSHTYLRVCRAGFRRHVPHESTKPAASITPHGDNSILALAMLMYELPCIKRICCGTSLVGSYGRTPMNSFSWRTGTMPFAALSWVRRLALLTCTAKGSTICASRSIAFGSADVKTSSNDMQNKGIRTILVVNRFANFFRSREVIKSFLSRL